VKPVIVDRRALAEWRDAIDFYEQRCLGLGESLKTAVLSAIDRVVANPEHFELVTRGGVRRCSVRRFPYDLYFFDHDHYVMVIAVAHQHRRPGYWRRRIPPASS
jgi:hypothetical protein